MQRTVRRKLGKLQTTFDYIKYTIQNVRMFVKGEHSPANNPPITKAPSKTLYIMLYSKSKTSMSKRLSMQVGISEAIRSFSTNNTYNLKFNQWLAGLIDGDGCFLFSKKGYASLEIVMETRDKHCLFLIKQRYGGSIKIKSNLNWLRYRLHHKQGLLCLINSVNGLLRNPNRILQLGKICEKYNITLLESEKLVYESAWLSGFFDSDGSIYLNLLSGQVFITASQKNRYILDDLVNLYRGNIYPLVKTGAFKWSVNRKDDILNLMDYFNINKSKSAKQKRIKLLKKYYILKTQKAHLSTPNSILSKNWKLFIKDWENYK